MMPFRLKGAADQLIVDRVEKQIREAADRFLGKDDQGRNGP